MRKHFTYNFIDRTINGSKAAINRANKGMNPEYTELTEMLAEHPDFKVIVKSPTKKEGKKTYKKLTFERMEEYITTQFKDTTILDKKIIELKSIMEVAETKGAKYPLTKKWFLATYKEYKVNDVAEAKIS